MGYAEEKAKMICSLMTQEEMVSQLRYDAPAIERLGIPSYNWWNEGLHGLARNGISTVFPQSIGLAAMFDEKAVKRVAEITATEARAKYKEYKALGDTDIYKGLTIWAPNVNIFRDPRWGRGQETYGEDPYLTSRLGVAYVQGLQGDGEFLQTAACAKHFAVHSGPEKLRHEFDARASEYDLEMTYLPAFEALVKEAKVEGVMGAYNRVNGEVACASEYLMGKLEEWGFDGYFTSDCWAIQDFHMHHHVTETPAQSAAMAVNAGCDLNCGCSYQHLLPAIANGLVKEGAIEKACYHLMRTRVRLGCFEEKEPFDRIPYTCVSSEAHKKLSLECARRSMVLLENNGILPLDEKSYKTIAVIGPNATSLECLNGNYNGTADKYVTFLDGIRDRFKGRVLYSVGSHLYKDRWSVLAKPGDTYAEAIVCAKNSDLVILCLGLDPTIEGEEGDTGNEFSSGDKECLKLPESQRHLLSKVMALGKPVVVVVAAGSAINTLSHPDALIHAWYPGSEGGTALAEILFGDVSPSGKLPVTFYENDEDLPDFTDYSMQGRTYRYTRENILYPFGYGLTYGKVVVESASYEDDRVIVKVKNAGTIKTEDVIEVYIKGNAPEEKEILRLCGFKRIKLSAGESKEYVIPLPKDSKAFTCCNASGKRARYSDRFTLYVGTHQPDHISTRLSNSQTVKLEISF